MLHFYHFSNTLVGSCIQSKQLKTFFRTLHFPQTIAYSFSSTNSNPDYRLNFYSLPSIHVKNNSNFVCRHR